LYYRLAAEIKTIRDRFRVSPTHKLNDNQFICLFETKTIGELWEGLSKRPYPGYTEPVNPKELDIVIPGESSRVIALADQTLGLKINILGSGVTTLAFPISWDVDFKAQVSWPLDFFRDIDILNPYSNSDVKVPWELSRLQWLIPVGQAYMLTNDEKYADFALKILTDWILANPYGRGVNWAIAMEAAMRIFTWTWLFHVFKFSAAWKNSKFQISFLRSLFEHAVFVKCYFEDYGVGGNHCTADASALVFAGLFFGESKTTTTWEVFGWSMLSKEMPLQVFPDGVNFEGSIAYHRFVLELFFWSAKYRRVCNKIIPKEFRKCLFRMAEFSQSYTKPNGQAPLWGDTDDGRVFPFGGQVSNDHSYLANLIHSEWKCLSSCITSLEAQAEIFWTYGEIKEFKKSNKKPISSKFRDAGFFIMQNDKDHVFIDCGPVGLNGRGGHGHNDCLSFEATLNSTPLITDSGTYVYTGSYKERNIFRGTASHNTPMVDGIEQNRFITNDELFSLRYDARPKVRSWQTNPETDIFIGSHFGYQRLDKPVVLTRKVVLEKAAHRLIVLDYFCGQAPHSIVIPLHFTPNCKVIQKSDCVWSITCQGNVFYLFCNDVVNWSATLRASWVSPSYGVKLESTAIEFSRNGSLEVLAIGIYPKEHIPDDPKAWLKSYI
jgi:uncharacterized heparinase superfamily protein